MKTWKEAEIVELDLIMTAYGKNPKAKEANAGKHPNNGAGGSLLGVEPDGETDTSVTPDTLS